MANPRAEAEDKLGGDYEARVLEPSPPAVTEFPYADDPVAPGEVPEGRRLVSPLDDHGDLSWDDMARAEPDIAQWCAERWLGAWKRLEPLPPTFAETRKRLHEMAEQVLAKERRPSEEIALRYTRGGFGTPFFRDDARDCQVRVEHGELVRQQGDGEERKPIDGVDADAATALGDFYGLGSSVLEQLRMDNSDGDPSMVQLWPEHFDLAIELGDADAGSRANLGFSPGDDDHTEPYLYVGPWDTEKAKGELWNGKGFTGAELAYAELIAADDQRQAALEFMRSRYDALAR